MKYTLNILDVQDIRVYHTVDVNEFIARPRILKPGPIARRFGFTFSS